MMNKMMKKEAAEHHVIPINCEPLKPFSFEIMIITFVVKYIGE